MYVIIWEYQVRAEHTVEFQEIYGPDGRWADLFKNGNGFLEIELLRDQEDPQRYITIDRWNSLSDYELFLSQWKKEYEALDSQCEGLTEQETLSGKWKVIDYETR